MKLSPEALFVGEKARLKKLLTIFVVVAILWAGVSVTLLLLSKGRQYLWFMVADMVISVAFGWYAVWFFTNPYRDGKNLLSLYRRMSASAETTETGVCESVDEHTKENILSYRVTALTGGGERYLTLLEGAPFTIEPSKRYLFTTRANVIVDCEAQDE
ncbi:MAG: hypothetical protein J5762_02445 [Clostridia bacterium]|nr:hypothetical protein [Clostridia bacterium]